MELWTRRLPTYGVLLIATRFNRVVLVASGARLGPCLSLLMVYSIPCRILLSTRDPAATYEQEVVNEVYNAIPNTVIIPTKGVVSYTVLERYKPVRELDAKAVFVVWNAMTTKMGRLWHAEQEVFAHMGPFLTQNLRGLGFQLLRVS
ncbi:uncharacterized protein V1518DRAFT_158741 [Limtongia smithiae]|uniref:uncharacterized protein n=1 Tax=Limtongia smithiae TaxID=1125753 RepID=UPI0034CF330F